MRKKIIYIFISLFGAVIALFVNSLYVYQGWWMFFTYLLSLVGYGLMYYGAKCGRTWRDNVIVKLFTNRKDEYDGSVIWYIIGMINSLLGFIEAMFPFYCKNDEGRYFLDLLYRHHIAYYDEISSYALLMSLCVATFFVGLLLTNVVDLKREIENIYGKVRFDNDMDYTSKKDFSENKLSDINYLFIFIILCIVISSLSLYLSVYGPSFIGGPVFFTFWGTIIYIVYNNKKFANFGLVSVVFISLFLPVVFAFSYHKNFVNIIYSVYLILSVVTLLFFVPVLLKKISNEKAKRQFFLFSYCVLLVIGISFAIIIRSSQNIIVNSIENINYGNEDEQEQQMMEDANYGN